MAKSDGNDDLEKQLRIEKPPKVDPSRLNKSGYGKPPPPKPGK